MALVKKSTATKLCPFCRRAIKDSLVRHIRVEHGEGVLRQAVLADKRRGVADALIGEKYGISFSYLERVITQEYGTNISTVTRKRPKITQWEPKNFVLETTTVWSFKNRGRWATHDGRYRGNWSPYIPRNLILRYTQPNDVVLDYFVGGGTTAVEAKLLRRRCIASDINPEALALAKENLDFPLPQDMFSGDGRPPEPKLICRDARDLSAIRDESIDLICAHPPYAGIIRYSASSVNGDLSALSVDEFVTEMGKVARESYRVLKSGRQCAILIGDSRKSKKIVPISFLTMRAFLDAGFVLRELIVKRQHNCKATGFWYSNSVRYNFLLLAHEFLPVFEKPPALKIVAEDEQPLLDGCGVIQQVRGGIKRLEGGRLETTTVWIFPFHEIRTGILRNLLGRFAKADGSIAEIDLNDARSHPEGPSNGSLVYVFSSDPKPDPQEHFSLLDGAIAEAMRRLPQGGFCAVEALDFRRHGVLVPMGLLTFEHLRRSGLELREIVIVTSEENLPFEPAPAEYLGIAHKYLLIYRKP